MATYFKYAERSADSFVNWAEIGKNISDTLREEARIREEKKAAIDKATRDYGEQLANAPQGENRDVNRWTLNFADEAQQARLLQDRLLKSGMLKLKDYNIQRQNLTDGTKNLFNLSKEYQEEYKLKMERMKSADPKTRSQALESYLMSTVEGFANFSESKALINPTDYTVGVGMLKKNPETGVMEVTGDTATVNSLRNRIKGKFDYFDVDDANKSISGRLAEYVKAEIQRGSSTKAGFVITTEDAMKRPGYQKALDEAIDSFLVTPYNTSSVLTNSIGIEQSTGKAFSFTYSEEEAKKNKNLILLKTVNDMPVPQFTKEQTEAVKSFMKGQIEQQIKFDQKISPYQEPRPERATQAELAWAKTKESTRDIGNLLGQIYSGDDQEATAATGYFNGLESVTQANRTKTGFDLLLPSGITKTVPFFDKNGNPIGKTNFVRSATSLLLGDKADINEAVRGSLRTKSDRLNTNIEAIGQTKIPAKKDAEERLKEYFRLKKEFEVEYGDKQ
jgi:hypothetical protein